MKVPGLVFFVYLRNLLSPQIRYLKYCRRVPPRHDHHYLHLMTTANTKAQRIFAIRLDANQPKANSI